VAHGGTLLGAIDTFLGRLAHTRPWLVASREQQLGALAEAWLEQGGANWLPSLSTRWIARHVAELSREKRMARAEAAADLLAWAKAEGLRHGGP
jgi:hypothetical protein